MSFSISHIINALIDFIYTAIKYDHDHYSIYIALANGSTCKFVYIMIVISPDHFLLHVIYHHHCMFSRASHAL